MLTIDPSNLSSEHSKQLATFFNTQAATISTWKEGQTYTFEDGTPFQFTFDIVKRQRKEGNLGYRYEFISSRLLGAGFAGEVYEIEGTLAVVLNDTQFKPHGFKDKTRVVKIQQHNSENPVDTAWKEYAFTEGSQNLSTKPPTIVGTTSYLVMKKLKRKVLFEVLSEDRDGSHPLDLKQRVELTRGLLEALKGQVTKRGIIHRDIKGENIFVDLESSPIQISIFDYGLATWANRPDRKACGSAPYAPPEIFFGKAQTVKIDVFSLGRVLALLWHVDSKSYCYESQDRYAMNSLEVDLESLFKNIKGLSNLNKHIIRSMLAGMLNANSNRRYTIEEAIDLFAQVTLENPIARNVNEIGFFKGSSTTTTSTMQEGLSHLENNPEEKLEKAACIGKCLLL